MKVSYIKNSLSLAIALIFCALPAFAFDLDMSVDDEIRRTYDPSKLEQTLPALPKILQEETKPVQHTEYSAVTQPKTPAAPKTTLTAQPSKPQIGIKKFPDALYNSNLDKSLAIRIKKGTKFKVKSSAYISDTTKPGSRLTFTTLYPVTQRYITLPAGTSFKAVVVNSHPPQISGNGGLIELMVDGVVINGNLHSADGKVIKANYKKIFFNNIKGKRGYWKGVANQVDKGERFYKKTRRTSTKLADNPFGVIISPFPTIAGVVTYAVNFVGSPLFSIGSKGGHIAIPAGSVFEIKLREDAYLY